MKDQKHIKEVNKKLKYLDLFFLIVKKYLKSNGWEYSKVDCINAREENWRKGDKSVTHWENFKTSGVSSFHYPKHCWRIRIFDGTLSFSYGLAPY